MTKPTQELHVPVKAIDNLVGYLWDDTRRNYEESRLSADSRDHIWNSVKVVAAWLETLSDAAFRAADRAAQARSDGPSAINASLTTGDHHSRSTEFTHPVLTERS